MIEEYGRPIEEYERPIEEYERPKILKNIKDPLKNMIDARYWKYEICTMRV